MSDDARAALAELVNGGPLPTGNTVGELYALGCAYQRADAVIAAGYVKQPAIVSDLLRAKAAAEAADDARPAMSDSRVEKLAAGSSLREAHHRAVVATVKIEEIEAAGLLVIDPDDEATIERAAKFIAWRSWHGFHNTEDDYPNGMVTPDELWTQFVRRRQAAWIDDARGVLNALRGTE